MPFETFLLSVAACACRLAAFSKSRLCFRRLLNESFADSFENAIGHFLAAQHRAVTQTAFLETLKRAHQEDG